MMNRITVVTALVAIAGCTAGVTTESGLSETQRQELAELGVADALEVDGVFGLRDADGREMGLVAQHGARVEVQVGELLATLARRGRSLAVSCGVETNEFAANEMESWLETSDSSEECRRALDIARVVTGIDRVHANGCMTEMVEGVEQITCGVSDSDADAVGARRAPLLAGDNSGMCCAGDGWGFCPAECFGCGGGYAYECGPGGGDDGGGGGGGGDIGGGGIGGGAACSLFDWTSWFVEWNGSTPAGACATARAKGERACYRDSGSICVADVGRVVTVFKSNSSCTEGNCSCTMQVACNFSSRY